MSDATLMCGELLELVRGVIPRTSKWKAENPVGLGFHGSRNKPLVCKSCDAFDSYLKGDIDRAQRAVSWWVDFCRLPLSAGEELTGEEIYRGMMIMSGYAAASMAMKLGRPTDARFILDYVRAHVGWLALGVGCGPGGRVMNHHLDNLRTPVVIVGDGPPLWSLPYVAQAGMRGLSRSDKAPYKFQFTESQGLSAMLCLAARMNVPKSPCKWEVGMCDAVVEFTPSIDVLGFSHADADALRSFMRAPADPQKAQAVLRWVSGYAPSADFEFIRYIDGSIIMYMLKNHGSSTDDRMIDSWFNRGITRKASAADSVRKTHEAMTVYETPTTVVCLGLGSVYIEKPNLPIAYRVSVRSGVVSITGSIPVPPAAPPVAQPPVSDTLPRRNLKWWQKLMFWKRR